MTQDLRERLDDLVADVPPYVVPDARAAWSAGARRRTRHRIGVVAAAVVVVALLAGAVAWLPRTLDPAPAEPDSAGVDGYPARVVQLRPQDLPSAPGPMAMVFGQSDASWWVASAEGRAWPAPQRDLTDSYPPALSPDGRMLGYLASPDAYIVRDLVTGVQNGLSLDHAEDKDKPWHVAEQSPAFWSPDSTHLLLRVGGSADAVILGDEGGTTQELKAAGYPAGWLDDDTTAWLVAPEHGHRARIVGVDDSGRTVSSVTLDLHRVRASTLSQWSAAVSPDGSRVAVVDAQGTLWLYRLSDSKLLSSAPGVASDTCTASWAGRRPVAYATNQLQTLEGTAVTVFEVGDETTCAMAAADALAGKRYPGMGRWAQFTDWVVANPASAGAAALLVLLGVALLVVRLRRKRLEATS